MEPALDFPFGYSQYWIAVWTTAALLGGGYAVVRRGRWRRALGLALMSVPFWTAIWGFINSIPDLADPTTVRPTRSTYGLSSTYIRTLLIDIGYLGSGFLLWTAHRGWPRSVRDLAQRLRDEGVRWGPHEGRSFVIGWLWFPVLLFVTVGFQWLIQNVTPSLVTGDDSRIWDNMTVFHVVMISAAAAVTEELTYRVLILLGALHLLRRAGLGGRAAVVGAIALQALVFGMAHGGYGNVAHVLGPLFFGLIAGVAAVRFGIWSAIALHLLIDIYAFGVYAADNAPWFWVALWGLLIANVMAAGFVGLRWTWRRVVAPTGPVV